MIHCFSTAYAKIKMHSSGKFLVSTEMMSNYDFAKGFWKLYALLMLSWDYLLSIYENLI